VPEATEADTVVPFTNIRRRTAEHMVRSKRTSAHTMVAVEVDYSAVEKVRLAERARFREAEGFSLTYLPFVTRATVDAMEQFPHVNSSVGDDALIVHHDVNIGIAVDLDFEGLLVPVINQPQVAILSTDGVRKKPVAVELPDGSDGIAVHPVGNLVLSWDHRAFDGAYAAAFLKAIKDIIETRDWASEL